MVIFYLFSLCHCRLDIFSANSPFQHSRQRMLPPADAVIFKTVFDILKKFLH